MSVLTLLLTSAFSYAADVTEYEVKAAMLCKFALFVEWPSNAFEDAGSPLRIGVLGQDPFGSFLEREAGTNTIQHRPVVIQHHTRIEPAIACHILFISASEQSRLPAILAQLKGKPTLTVSDAPSFCQNGGMIGFLLRSRNVRFEINPVAAKEAGLQMNPKLLPRAVAVWPNPGREGN